MFEDLEKLIDLIVIEYNKQYEEWKQSEFYIPINQKQKRVEDIEKDDSIFKAIINYRKFINEKHIELSEKFNKLKLDSDVTSRVKIRNSIENKAKRYMLEKHAFGKISLNKCFNDLYGIRITLKQDMNYEDIKKNIEIRYEKKLKCMDSSNGNYVATHIYFKNGNESFQWELQIWDKKHEKTNLISHEQYKQNYTKWEKENK